MRGETMLGETMLGETLPGEITPGAPGNECGERIRAGSADSSPRARWRNGVTGPAA
ncbi:hypothetical protein KAJ83_13045 [Marivibrio halodurans]|uniref:Uncharacterized protein n=1 Tax=Marivibrio halodurans TaxID=2039722 RepID=A0A8J7S3C3_9PROT|nr:hypothetical protein [Marivibrio halodurans]MBP5857939.1 hypothetical protein [Marivibrio halodurans]